MKTKVICDNCGSEHDAGQRCGMCSVPTTPECKATARPFHIIESAGSQIIVANQYGNIFKMFRFDSFMQGTAQSTAALIVTAVNEYEPLCKVAEAAQALMDALATADKQWIGLNMLNAGQKRAYEIQQEGKIKAEKALSHLAALRKGK